MNGPLFDQLVTKINSEVNFALILGKSGVCHYRVTISPQSPTFLSPDYIMVKSPDNGGKYPETFVSLKYLMSSCLSVVVSVSVL